jgi:hypothetical protein
VLALRSDHVTHATRIAAHGTPRPTEPGTPTSPGQPTPPGTPSQPGRHSPPGVPSDPYRPEDPGRPPMPRDPGDPDDVPVGPDARAETPAHIDDPRDPRSIAN